MSWFSYLNDPDHDPQERQGEATRRKAEQVAEKAAEEWERRTAPERAKWTPAWHRARQEVYDRAYRDHLTFCGMDR
jgi:hypothetical protein